MHVQNQKGWNDFKLPLIERFNGNGKYARCTRISRIWMTLFPVHFLCCTSVHILNISLSSSSSLLPSLPFGCLAERCRSTHTLVPSIYMYSGVNRVHFIHRYNVVWDWLNCHYHRKSVFIHRRLNKNRFCRLSSAFCHVNKQRPGAYQKDRERERERDRVMVECKSFAWRNLLCYQPILLENEATRHHYNTLSSEKKWQWLSSGTMFLADACFATWLTHLVQWHTGNWGRFFTRDIKKEQKEQQTHTP